jgi:hypothetical protein
MNNFKTGQLAVVQMTINFKTSGPHKVKWGMGTSQQEIG